MISIPMPFCTALVYRSDPVLVLWVIPFHSLKIDVLKLFCDMSNVPLFDVFSVYLYYGRYLSTGSAEEHFIRLEQFLFGNMPLYRFDPELFFCKQ